MEEIYRIKVTLLGTSPPTWRRLQLLVPADVTLAYLHNVLQAAMGWEDCHLHEFRIAGKWFGTPDPDDRLMGIEPVSNDRTVPLSSVLRRVGAKATYTYDLGDSWEHGIVLEKRLAADPNLTYPLCTGGQRACPPEDCGALVIPKPFRSTTSIERSRAFSVAAGKLQEISSVAVPAQTCGKDRTRFFEPSPNDETPNPERRTR